MTIQAAIADIAQKQSEGYSSFKLYRVSKDNWKVEARV